MAEPKPAAWRLLDFVLVELGAVLVLWTVAVAIGGAAALPWSTQAERVGGTNRAVAAAAERGVEAFLDVDYRRVDDDSDEVMRLSTNPFREQYYNGSTDLRMAAMQARSVSKGSIRAVGVEHVGEGVASILVAADSVVTSTRAKTPKRGHYRFIVTLRNVDGAWLMSNLAEAP